MSTLPGSTDTADAPNPTGQPGGASASERTRTTRLPRSTRARQPRRSTILLPAQALLGLVVIAIFIVTFAVQPFRIPSSSMVPTLLVGDFLLVDKQTATKDAFPLPPGTLHRGDIIVFHFPPDPSVHLVKRVIALPGDRVRLHDDHVFINGQVLREPYALYRPSPRDAYRDDFPHLSTTDPDVDSRWWMELRRLERAGELLIPANQYFVLGDNRNNSEDSRYWGLVPAVNVVGKPLLVYLSLREPESGAPAGGPRGVWDSLRGLARWRRELHIVR